MSYFRVVIDPRISDCWFLDDPLTVDGNEIDSREFTEARRYDGPVPASVPIYHKGPIVKFHFAAFDMPVLAFDVAEAIWQIAPECVQRFPVTVSSSRSGFEILNVICSETCVDEKHTKILRWEVGDGRPDKVGQYRMIVDLTIDPQQARGRHIFRIKGWEIALIVSDVIKTRLECFDNLGIAFTPVCRWTPKTGEHNKV